MSPAHRSADAHIRNASSQVFELADVGIRAPIGRQFKIPMRGRQTLEVAHEPVSHGVRPSSGAAALCAKKLLEEPGAFVRARAAAPEDGRTPGWPQNANGRTYRLRFCQPIEEAT